MTLDPDDKTGFSQDPNPTPDPDATIDADATMDIDTSAESSDPEDIPSAIGPYQIIRRLGGGGPV